ncbi:SAM-dependent methyltransferase [Candidatus Thiodictyon syntrophicum]|jgi:cyclopropane-fatty-acyl-phospholipid synthase|uniref:SAM-dependent methyltransferase n=1 Tax=Candidatus Thiodictyon syntrophicum TaxID=1166950 RepID=A0A2K8U3Y2_9GAMM|nr:cyclopropane-fatty-acyl-phospholipid synthase family protein [Candidatus Thiodictyon syntrophicum]AUB80109.1 SAM-dependent methyltransferase [Candidatus Thiodictyon syntrophicum]
MHNATTAVIRWVEQGRVPDAMTRAGIRALLRQRLATLPTGDCALAAEETRAFVAMMDASPIAAVPELANAQHYELPPEFFVEVLGPRRKYSSCLWSAGVQTLAQAEDESLRVTAERAGIADGMEVLELGCGWGAFSLYVAERFPRCRVTAVSNSQSQRGFIEGEARRRGLANLTLITADMNTFAAPGRYDRIVSIEMFEHMRNHRALFARVHDWLKPGGRFLMHIFCHRAHPYAFEDQGPSDWMSRYFFSGGIMPSDELPLLFQDRLRLLERWRWDGRHYERTLNTWLEQMDAARPRVWPILEQTYGTDQAAAWWMRWRLFFMACAELFGYRNGQEWWVSHYLFERPA